MQLNNCPLFELCSTKWARSSIDIVQASRATMHEQRANEINNYTHASQNTWPHWIEQGALSPDPNGSKQTSHADPGATLSIPGDGCNNRRGGGIHWQLKMKTQPRMKLGKAQRVFVPPWCSGMKESNMPWHTGKSKVGKTKAFK